MQMYQLASYMSRLRSQGELPMQTKHNLKPNVNATSLRSGKIYKGRSRYEPDREEDEKES